MAPDETRPQVPPAAAMVLSCSDLDANVAFFGRLGFRVDLVFPDWSWLVEREI